MNKAKHYFILFLLTGILLSGCKQLKHISNKLSDNPNVEKDQLAELKAASTSSKQLIERNLEISENLIEPSADSLSEVNQIFDTIGFANFFSKRIGSIGSIEEDLSMLSGSAIIQQLDSLAAIKIFDRYHFETNPEVLNVYKFKPEDRPVYSDSVYALRIEILNIQTPIDLEYNQHVKGYINLYTGKGRNQLSRMLGLAEIYFPLFEEALDKYNIPLEIKYLAVVESALNPTAGSRAGAKGLWQFMYLTGKMYGLNQTSMVDDRFDPYKSTEAACQHMVDLFAIYNDWNLVLAAYNSGPGNVNRAIRKAGGLKNYWAIWPFLPRETRGYVPAFIAVNYVFNFAAEHNVYPTSPGILYNQIDSITVRDVLSFDQIAEFMKLPVEDVRFLNPAYKEDIIPAINGQKYILRLPRQYINYFIENEDSLYAFKSTKGMERENLMVKIKDAKQRSIHIVRSGENLGLIANKYRTSVSRIQALNGLKGTNIYPGQKLIVFNSEGIQKSSSNTVQKSTASTSTIDGITITHTVKSGDTLWDIAKAYNSTIESIRELNQLGTSSKLQLGQKLKVRTRT